MLYQQAVHLLVEILDVEVDLPEHPGPDLRNPFVNEGEERLLLGLDVPDRLACAGHHLLDIH